jgi:hypothetical protein
LKDLARRTGIPPRQTVGSTKEQQRLKIIT